jgi:hypothetical protein
MLRAGRAMQERQRQPIVLTPKNVEIGVPDRLFSGVERHDLRLRGMHPQPRHHFSARLFWGLVAHYEEVDSLDGRRAVIAAWFPLAANTS